MTGVLTVIRIAPDGNPMSTLPSSALLLETSELAQAHFNACLHNSRGRCSQRVADLSIAGDGVASEASAIKQPAEGHSQWLLNTFEPVAPSRDCENEVWPLWVSLQFLAQARNVHI